METRLVAQIPDFGDHNCVCGSQATGIWRENPKQKWQYKCTDCLGDLLALSGDILREVFDVK